MTKDEIDFNRAEVWTLIYLTASVDEGVTRVHPDVHGIYETYEAAELARKSKGQPNNYYTRRARWRKV
jgi:hypothetical protein